MITRFVAFGALALSIGFGAGASADPQTPAPSPTPINLPTLPPSTQINPYVKLGIELLTGIVKNRIATDANASSGQVTYFKRFEMQVQTSANGYRAIHLHQGTVINPRGESLQPGQRVDVSGVAQADGSLDANVITIRQ